MKVEICSEGLEKIVRHDLSSTLKNLKSDLQRRKNGDRGCIFYADPRQDIEELQRHVEAFKTVMKYYGAA